MDGVSLGLGVAGFVVQSLDIVVGCIEAIRNFRDAGDKNATLNCMLFIEQYHLQNWGRHCELSKGNLAAHLPTPESQAVALMILRNMLEVVAETEKLRTRYGMSFFQVGDEAISQQTQMAFGMWANMQNKMPISNFTPAIPKQRTAGVTEIPSLGSEEEEVFYDKSIKKGKISMKFMRKCRWVVNDSKKFEEMIKQLKDFNLSLDRLVSPRFQSQQAIRTETDILQNTPDRELPVLERATVTTRPALSNAASIRARVSRLEPQGSSVDEVLLTTPLRNLEIKLEQLDLRPIPRSGCQTRAMANYQPKHGEERAVLVEWRDFDSGLTQYTRDATVKRASSLAQIMASEIHQDPTNTFRKLDCAGYFVTNERVGYVFELPKNTNPSSNPRPLLSLLHERGVAEDDREDIDKPPLEQSELVHKGIRSDNILFFKREGDRTDHVRLEEPYITGFDHSRPDGPDDPTITKTTLSTDEDRYRHPDFHTSTSRRSTKIHDLYSLGLVLLEIAHWWKLKSLVLDRTGEDMASFIRDEYGPVSELDQLMGSRYQDVVERCIRSRFGVRIEEKGALQRVFLDEIMAELMKCNV